MGNVTSPFIASVSVFHTVMLNLKSTILHVTVVISQFYKIIMTSGIKINDFKPGYGGQLPQIDGPVHLFEMWFVIRAVEVVLRKFVDV